MKYTDVTKEKDSRIPFGDLCINSTFLNGTGEIRVKCSGNSARAVPSGSLHDYSIDYLVRQIVIVNVDYELV